MYALPPEAFKQMEYNRLMADIRTAKELKKANHEYKMQFFKKGVDCIELTEIKKPEFKFSEGVKSNLFPIETKEESIKHWNNFNQSRGK
jgi:hypothetical protein